MIYDLLCQIRQKYALYIGRKDVRRLGIFLSGYECALFDAMGFFPEFNGRFQQFVGKKLGMLHSKPALDRDAAGRRNGRRGI